MTAEAKEQASGSDMQRHDTLGRFEDKLPRTQNDEAVLKINLYLMKSEPKLQCSFSPKKRGKCSERRRNVETGGMNKLATN